MKLLILGSDGMVGHVVTIYMKEHGHEVTGVAEKDHILDDFNKLGEMIKAGQYDSVINCTAVINDDAEADKTKAVYINSLLPHWLAEVTRDMKTVVVHRGTDCIFSGNRGEYGLKDWPDRANFYGRSKALGEIVNDKDITIRISLIGPETDENGTGLFNWFYNQKETVNGFANAIWTGVTTIEFAKQIEWMLDEGCHGLFQTVPKEAISKYELVRLFEKYYPGSRDVKRVDNDRVDRSLIQVKPEGLVVPGYEEQIAEMKQWTDGHKELYRY